MNVKAQVMRNPLARLLLGLFRSLFALFRSKAEPKPSDLPFSDVLKEYIKNHFKENTDFTESTRRKYDQYQNNILLFLRYKGLDQSNCMSIRISTMEQLKSWLFNNLSQCGKTHAARHIELCKRVMRYAVKNEIIPYSPIEQSEAKRDRVKEVVHLELQELIKMMFYEFANDIFELTADYYVFQSSTGLSYADVTDYEIQEIDGEEWIYGRRHKTDRSYWVPLTLPAKILHEKYAGVFPYLSNASYNKMLKEIALILGIKKHLTTHTARKTFATLMNNAGFSRATIMDMMGIKTEKVLVDHYLYTDYKRVQKEWRERQKLAA